MYKSELKEGSANERFSPISGKERVGRGRER
jgi:hypothetical protein